MITEMGDEITTEIIKSTMSQINIIHGDEITFSDYHLYNSSNSTLQLGNKEIKMFRKKNNPNSLIKNQDY